MSQRPSDDSLRRWLRAGDPAEDGRGPTRQESAELRRRMLTALPEARPTRSWLSWATAAAAVTLAASVALLRPGEETDSRPRGTATTASSQAAAPAPGAESQRGDSRRQIQFATENGTRIIWVLDPDLTF